MKVEKAKIWINHEKLNHVQIIRLHLFLFHFPVFSFSFLRKLIFPDLSSLSSPVISIDLLLTQPPVAVKILRSLRSCYLSACIRFIRMKHWKFWYKVALIYTSPFPVIFKFDFIVDVLSVLLCTKLWIHCLFGWEFWKEMAGDPGQDPEKGNDVMRICMLTY